MGRVETLGERQKEMEVKSQVIRSGTRVRITKGVFVPESEFAFTIS